MNTTAIDLSIIIPTRNQQDEIQTFLQAVRDACDLSDVDHIRVEALIVDDSDDATPTRVSDIARSLTTSRFAMQLMHRPSSVTRVNGVSGAICEGMRRAQGTYVAVLNADGQHPPEQVMRLYQVARVHDADIVLGSRFRSGGTYIATAGGSRRGASRGASLLVRALFPEHLQHLTDPLSSFFLIRQTLVHDIQPRQAGYRVGLDLLVRAPWTKLVEVPYTFWTRSPGVSKSSFRRSQRVLSQCAGLFMRVPLAAAGLKMSLLWLLGTALSYFPYALMRARGFSLWPTWLVALEVLLLVVATGTTLNETHHLSPRGLVWRWLTAHWRYLAPIGASAAVTLLLTPVVPWWYVTYAGAALVGLLTWHLMDVSETPRQVAFTSASDTLDETISFGRRDQGGRAMTAVLTGSALLACTVGIGVEQLGPVAVTSVLLLGGALVLQYNLNRTRTITVLLGLATAVATIDYAYWRVAMTNWTAWYVAVPLLLAEFFGMVHTLGLQWTLWPRKAQRVRRLEDPSQRPIYIFIPTVSEGREILGPTVRAALASRKHYLRSFPHGQVQIVLCNDGFVAGVANWEEPKQLARELRVRCVTRRKGGGAKAGNIEHARQVVGAVGEALLVVFDADQVAERQFLTEIIAPFADPEIGWVQSGQYYGNVENPVARWANDQQALFYHLICPGKESLNAAFLCGTNLMIRAAALDEIGGFPQESITEDFAASLELHARWRSVYLPKQLAVGLGPLDLVSYFKQQRRWAVGTLTVLRTSWPRVFLPYWGGLRLRQRLQYALSCTHYLCGVRDLIYVTAPIIFVWFGASAVKNGTLSTYLWHFLPYWVVSMSAFVYAAWKRTGWRGIVIGFASFPTLVFAVLTVVFRRRQRFTVTAKRRVSGGMLGAMLPLMLAWALTVASLIHNLLSSDVANGAVFFVEVWLVYGTIMLSLTLGLAAHDMLFHFAWWRAWQQARVRWRRVRVYSVFERVASGLAGVALVLSLVACATGDTLPENMMRLLRPLGAEQLSTVVPAASLQGKPPMLGIAGSTDTLERDIPVLQSATGARFGLVGRTQKSTDHFDQAWAEALSQQGAYPWLTVQFGSYGPDGTPSLDASLLAIANGYHDHSLTRLAHEMRAFGKPVLLTIIPNTDRNWSLSSAVANGGIPVDAQRAWKHAHKIFADAGATNVAWVWAPKDPAHDDAYAPPPAEVDYVAVSMTYDATGATDTPAFMLNVMAQHPGKEILIEVTVTQIDQQEQAWLHLITEQGSALSTVSGWVYFDGIPGVDTGHAVDPETVATLWQAITADSAPVGAATHGA